MSAPDWSLLGLLLAAIGTYGFIAHHVVQRTNEIGIRMALVVGQGLRLALIGGVLGLAGAYAVVRMLAANIPKLHGADVFTALSATALLIGVTTLACWLPALRAAKVDPMTALRAE